MSKFKISMFVKKVEKGKASDLYSAFLCTPKASGQATSNALPSLTGAAQATAHSLHTKAWAATRPLARQRQSVVGLHLHNPSLMDYYSFN